MSTSFLHYFFTLSLPTLVLSDSWTYKNIPQWNTLKNSFCTGTINDTDYPQSPINIDTSTFTIKNTCSLDWDLTEISSNVSYVILNTGHSLKLTPVQMHSHSEIFEDTTVQTVEYYLNDNIFSIAHLTTNSTSVTNIDEQFCLHSIHFHWGTNNSKGSEHTLNSIQYPLEAHFVHFLCNYSSISDAISAGIAMIADGDENPYTLAVVGVIFELQNDTQSTSYSAFDAIFDAIDNNSVSDERNGSSSIFVSDLNLSELVSESLTYYTYEGSFTTPLCIPIVRWYVLQNVMGVSVDHLMGFRDILDMDLFRDVQSLIDGAYVSECDIVVDSSDDSSDDSSSTTVDVESTEDRSGTGGGDDDEDTGRIVIIVVLVVVCVVVLLILAYFLKTRTNCMSKIGYSSVSGSQDDRYTHDL